MPPAPLKSRLFRVKLALAALLVAAGDLLFYQWELSHGWAGLFAAALLAALIVARPDIRNDRRALAAWGAAALFAGLLVWDTNALGVLLLGTALGFATLLPATARFDDGWRWLQRFVVHGFLSLFGPLIDLVKLGRARRRAPTGLNLRGTLPALILPIIGTMAFILLFASANPVIDAFIEGLSLPTISGHTIGRMILWGLLFGIVWAVLRPRRLRRFLPVLSPAAANPLPGVSPLSVTISLVLFNLLFAVQNVMDLAWLWGLMPLPEGLTLADYAHRGAYPLIVTALLAALFVLVTLRPGSATASVPAIRKLVALWLGQNVVLVLSSMLRTIDYVDAYSLTRLRIAALAWMVLVAAGLVLIGWRLMKERSGAWLINANLASAGLMLGVYAFVDTGAVAAQWNVRHAREIDGSGAGIDLCYLYELGPSALLALIELEGGAPSADLRERARRLRIDAQWRLSRQLAQGEWTMLGQQRLARAEALVGKTQASSQSTDCDGYVWLPEVAPASALPPAAPSPAAGALTDRSEQ